MTLDELSREYNGHWMGVKVIKRDEAGQPSEVEIVARDIDFYAGREQLKKDEEYCVLYAGSVPENNLTVMY